MAKKGSLMENKVVGLGLSFDDVLALPRKSGVLPAEVSVKTQLTKSIQLNIPILSAAMDTVTEDTLAIALARLGGLGILHRNCNIERRVEMVHHVKRAESGIITKPYTLSPAQTVREARNLMQLHKISGIPIVQGNVLIGLVTHRDIEASPGDDKLLNGIMTPFKKLITAPPNINLDEAEKILHQRKIEKLPLVDGQKLMGLITLRDIQNLKNFPEAAKDKKGRLRVGAAIGVGKDALDEAKALWEAGIDVLVIDTAHGHSEGVLETLEKLKANRPGKEIIAGNIATAEAARDLIDAGADAVKVGIGPGSICTTRVVAGIGVPQITAIMWVYEECQKRNIPLIADGGIEHSGDLVKAITAGADAVMLGQLFAGADESPSEMVILEGKKFKEIRGMGSLGALQTGSQRYPQAVRGKYVPEGIEGRVVYRGSLAEIVFQLVGGLKAGMGYCGSPNIAMQKTAQFIQITQAGVIESHPHGVFITREAPNYTGRI